MKKTKFAEKIPTREIRSVRAKSELPSKYKNTVKIEKWRIGIFYGY